MGRSFENRKHAIFKTAAQKSKLYSKYGTLLYVTAKGGVPAHRAGIATAGKIRLESTDTTAQTLFVTDPVASRTRVP